MKPRTMLRLGLPFLGLLVAGVAACAGGGTLQSGSSALPNLGPKAGTAARQSASGLLLRAPGPYTGTKPPFKPGETLKYAWNRSETITRWNGPSASPSTGPAATARATFEYAYSVDKKSGIYTEVETDTTSTGTSVRQTTLFGFVPSGGQVARTNYWQTIAETASGGFATNTVTTYPTGQTSFLYPAKGASPWSGAADEIFSSVTSQKGAYSQNWSQTSSADGRYAGQDQFSSSAGGFAEQFEFIHGSPIAYVLSAPSYASNSWNPERWTFAPPKSGTIGVTTSGTQPLPYPPGTTHVPDWYPGKTGKLPSSAATDNYKVVGSVKMPAQCGKLAGQKATDVRETFTALDPIFGFYEDGTIDYYLDTTDTVQCEPLTEVFAYYANGNEWESLGSWGGPWYRENYSSVEVLTSKSAATGRNARLLAAMPALPHMDPRTINGPRGPQHLLLPHAKR